MQLPDARRKPPTGALLNAENVTASKLAAIDKPCIIRRITRGIGATGPHIPCAGSNPNSAEATVMRTIEQASAFFLSRCDPPFHRVKQHPVPVEALLLSQSSRKRQDRLHNWSSRELVGKKFCLISGVSKPSRKVVPLPWARS